MATAADIQAEYRARSTTLHAAKAGAERRVNHLGHLRLAAFAAIAVLAARWATAAGWHVFWALATLAAVVAFGALVRASRRARDHLQLTDDMARLSDEGAARTARAWNDLPERDWGPADPAHPYAVDLDLFGRASLSALLPPMSRAPGRPVMRRWLLEPAPAAALRARQQAVAELRDDPEFRDAMAAAAMRMGVAESEMAALTTWAAGNGWLSERPGLVVVTIAIPIATLALLGAQLGGLVTYPYWLVPLMAAWVVTARHAHRIAETFAPVAGRATMLRRFALATRLAEARAPAAPLLQELRARLSAPTLAHRAIRRLTTVADSAELRLSPMLYFAVQSLTLWDFHVVRALERWRADSGRHAADWFAALGEIEALAALATLAHDNPGWCFPTLDAGSTSLEAEALGHPLLADGVCVHNDVSVGPPGTVLVVTGSNMAGKSTLLRAIGLNLVLAQAGGPVCARAFRHPAAALHTSMTVQDSLARGVSYFMAELERLKSVVDGARAVPAGAGRVFVYLLDEMLNGTNSAERSIAGRQVLRHLLDAGAIGVVSTHDLQLVDDRELATVARHIHLTEQFSLGANGAAAMTFDYRVRPGKATSTNALKLLELVGLGRRADQA